MRLFHAIFTLLVFAPVLLAGPVATLDLTTHIDPEPHFIVFCGRDNSLTGHAFVAWGREDSAHQMSVSDGAFGLYPQSDQGVADTVKMVFAPVPGRIAQEEVRRSLAADLIRLIVRVDRATYQATLARKAAWAARTDYQLIERDCISFASEIAAATGLALPPRETLDRPWDYVARIIAANPQEDFFNGDWTSTDAARRFRVRIRGDDCEWTEGAADGTSFVHRATLERSEGSAIGRRPNDEAALKFLGFQPSLRAEVLKRSPGPSYLKLRRVSAERIDAEWFGLLVTKDAQARLKELFPPGSQPGKPMTFTRR